MSEETAEMAEYIKQYRAQGLSFFPIPYKSKEAVIKWKEYQERKPTEEEIARWGNNGVTNLAIVCGKISNNLVVLDCDSEDTFWQLCVVIVEKVNIDDILEYTRISQTARGFHIWFFVNEPVRSVKFPNLDIKGEGGYIIVPPSVHPSGAKYKFLNDTTPIKVINSLADIGIDINQKPVTTPTTNTGDGQPIPGGQRNDTLASFAGTMRRRGMPQEAIEAALLEVNRRQCQPPLPEEEVRKISQSVSHYPPNGYVISLYKNDTSQQNESESNRNKNATVSATGERGADSKTQQQGTEPLSKRIEEWIKAVGSGWFDTPELDRDLGITSTADKNNRREVMLRLEVRGVIERHHKIAKQFRFVNKNLSPIDFKTANREAALPLYFPLGEETKVKLFRSNLVVIAGATNSGKTGWLLRFVYMNHNTSPMPIYYWCSEMESEELGDRLDQFEDMEREDWNFHPFSRSVDFADVIAPGCINIVDYLELTEDLYAINTHLTAITRKLGTGLALVAIQKKEGAKYGRGQEFSAEKSKLYLSMDKNRLTIVKGKCWAVKDHDPNGLRVNFTITRGCEFTVTRDWYRPSEE